MADDGARKAMAMIAEVVLFHLPSIPRLSNRDKTGDRLVGKNGTARLLFDRFHPFRKMTGHIRWPPPHPNSL